VRFKLILFLVFSLVFSITNAKKGFTIKTVVIDAGHGGKDPGATGPDKVNEKDVALAVALKFGAYIEKNFPGINVIYTRKTDVFLELHERADIANQNKADLFIAIHCNSSPNNEAYGTSTYVLGLHRTEANLEVAKRENSVILLEDDRDKNYEFDPNTAEGHIIMSMKQNAFLDQSIDVASKVENQYENYARRKSLGVKQAGFYVLYKTTMPSFLSEIGFISNPDEEKYLNSNKGQQQIAESLFNAFKEYKSEVENGKGEEGSSADNNTGTQQANAGATSTPVAATTTTTTVTTPTASAPAIVTTTTTTTNNPPAVTPPVNPPAPVPVPNSTSVSATTTTKVEAPPVLISDTQTVTLHSGKVIKKPVENSSGGGNVLVAKPVETPPVVKQVVKDTVWMPPATPTTTATVTTTTNTVVTKTNIDTSIQVKPQVPVAVKETKPEPISPPVITKAEDKPKQPDVTETKVIKTEPKPVASNTVTEVKAEKPAPPVASKTPTPKVETKAVPKTEPKSESGISFKIQLFALKGTLKDADQAKMYKLFKDHSDEKIPTGLTRYYVGNTNSFSEAKRMLGQAIGEGYSGAFIVGTKDGRRMGPEEIKALDAH